MNEKYFCTYHSMISQDLAATFEEGHEVCVLSTDMGMLYQRCMEYAIVIAVSEIAEIHARVAFDEDGYPIRDDVERHASTGTVVGTSGHSSALRKAAGHSDVGAGRYAVIEKVATLGSGPIPSFVRYNGSSL
jgi:hypothetical protein